MNTIFDKILGTLREKDVATSSSGDTTKFLNERGYFVVPSGGNVIKLAACSGLAFVSTPEGPAFSWVDPDNVVLNESELAEWNATYLIRKEGSSYPADITDGTKVAETTKASATKNYYRDHNFVDTTQEEGKTYSYMLFSQTTAGAWNCLDANKYSSGTGLSWGQVQQFVRAGRGASLFPVGTVFYVDHPEYTHNDGTGLWFRVAGHDQVPAQDETLTHTMCLEMVDCLFSNQYDAGESTYALTEDTTAQAGKSYYSLSGSTYTKLVEGTDYEVGDTIPLASWYEKNIDGHNYGSNNVTQSNQIQWFNATGTTGQWFQKQTLWDVCSSSLINMNGFCKHLDPLFLAVVKPAKLTTAKCNAEGGGSITHYAKFWSLSMTQVFGLTNNGITENVHLDYYKNGGDKKKTLKDSTSYTTWWLRSPVTGYAYYVYTVQASGASDYRGANFAYGFSLACIIA